MKSVARHLIAAAALASTLGSSWAADPTITQSASGSGVNVLSWNLDGTASDPWISLTGSLNSADWYANFVGSAPLRYAAGGQAVIEGISSNFNSVAITASALSTPTDNLSFLKFVIQVDAVADAKAVLGINGVNYGLYDISEKGSNWFTVTSTTPITSVTFSTFDTGCTTLVGCTPFDSIKEITQVRFDQIAAVPEPQAYALMLVGVGALGLIARRRRTVAR